MAKNLVEIVAEVLKISKHLPGQHDQSSHGGKGGGKGEPFAGGLVGGDSAINDYIKRMHKQWADESKKLDSSKRTATVERDFLMRSVDTGRETLIRQGSKVLIIRPTRGRDFGSGQVTISYKNKRYFVPFNALDLEDA